MNLSLIFFVIYFCERLEGKAQTWDTFSKHHQLISSQGVINWKSCGHNTDNLDIFREIQYNVTIETFKRISAVSNSHFVYSPHSLWLTLAGLAEGASGRARDELFEFLRLPQDECSRRQFYQLTTTLEPPSEDAILSRVNVLILDEAVNLDGYWENFVRTNSLLHTRSAPLKSDPLASADSIRNIMSLQLPTPNFEGNSLIVDTLDYGGLWTTAFSDAIVERAPFYNDFGKRIGYVDLMKIKKRVKMSYIPSINAKILELPVGFGSRYRMLIALNLGTTRVRQAVPSIMNSIFFEILETLKESIIPMEVAIPRFRMTTEVNLRRILEDIGVKTLWTDVEGTRNISEPAALPSSFIQRTTVTFDTKGVRAPIQEVSNVIGANLKSTYEDSETGLDPILGRDFIVDKPFLFGLFDQKTYTCLFCAAFSRPSYT